MTDKGVYGLYTLIACTAFVQGGPLKPIVEYKLRVDTVVGTQQFVRAVSVASIEQRIAVCVQGVDGRHLFVIDGEKIHKLDVPTSEGYWSCGDQLHWSPDGQVLVTQSGRGVRAWDFGMARGCEVSAKYANDHLIPLGFADHEHFVVTGGHDPGVLHGLFRDSRVALYDRQCVAGGFWIVKGRVYQGSTSSFSGLIAMQRADDPLVVLDASSGEQTESRSRYSALFADKGKTVCRSANIGREELFCIFDGHAGKERRSLGPRAIRQYSVAEGAPRLAALEYNYSRNPFTEVEHASPKNWLIWDIRADKILARLGAMEQTQEQGLLGQGRVFSSALSPSGRRFVVAGDDRVIVYEVPQD